MRIVDGFYEEVRDDSLTVARSLTAAGGPLFPPAEWYQDPQLDRPTPLTITDDGQIKGHIATWATDHIGLPPGTKPPHSRTDYALFKTGLLKLDDGNDTPVGQLTLAGGHAPMTAGAAEAVKHYDDTASAIADVTAGEDQHGIWISGGIRSGVTDEQIRALRASAPSGDWRPFNGALELVAVCQVNTPGFPVARAMVASGEITALVAAGAGDMYDLQQEQAIYSALTRTNDRVAELEAIVAGLEAGKKKKAATPFDADDDDEDKKESGDQLSMDKDDDKSKPEPEDDEDDDEKERKALREKFNKRRAAKK